MSWGAQREKTNSISVTSISWPVPVLIAEAVRPVIRHREKQEAVLTTDEAAVAELNQPQRTIPSCATTLPAVMIYSFAASRCLVGMNVEDNGSRENASVLAPARNGDDPVSLDGN